MSKIADRAATHLIEPLGWTLVHSIWQLACLAAVLALFIHLLGRRSANARYALCGVILCLMVALPAVTYCLYIPSVEISIDSPSTTPGPVLPLGEQESFGEQRVDVDPTIAVPLTADVSQSGSGAWKTPNARTAYALKPIVQPLLPWIVTAWVAGVFFNSVWHLGGWIAVQRMARLGTRPVSHAVHETLAELTARLESTRCVQVVESVIVQAPCVIGWLRPVILLPLGIVSGLSPSQLEAVLAHELAHVRRLDYLANLLQTVVETLLFYHPAAWYVSRRMRLEREYCADQLAAGILGDSIAYARALAAATEHVQFAPQFALAANAGSLMNRVRRLFGLQTRDGGRTGSWLLGATGSLLVVFSLVVVPPIHSALSSSTPRVTMRRVWADAATNTSGRVSPSGRYLAFINWDTGNLGLHDLEQGTSRLLTRDGTWAAPNRWADAPVWSPDSKQLAYVWMFDEQPAQLRILSLVGGTPRTVYRSEEGGMVYPTDWSPDGSHILVSLRDNTQYRRMALVNVNNGSIIGLRDLPRRSGECAFSPDGRYVAFVQQSAEDVGEDIFLYEMSTGNTVPLVCHPADESSPHWSPDGNWLTFLSTRTGKLATWMVPVADGKAQGEPRQMSPELEDIAVFGISQRGLYFYGRKASHDVFAVEYDPQRGRTAGDPRILVRRFEGHNRGAVWSPVGKKLAYLSVRPAPQGGTRTVPVVRDDATGRELINNADLHGFLRVGWLPDGNSVLLRATSRSREPGIYQWDLERGTTTPLVTWEPTMEGYVSWSIAVSPDATSIFYTVVRDGTAHLFRRLLETGKDEEIVAYRTTNAASALLSPIGKLLVLKEPHSIRVVDLDTRELRLLYEIEDKDKQRTHGVTWTRDGQHLLFWLIPTLDQTSLSSLWRIPVDGGDPVPVGLAGWKINDLDFMDLYVHPEGQQLVFSASRNTHASEVWAIENSLLVQDD